jgi:hypothetical protein
MSGIKILFLSLFFFCIGFVAISIPKGTLQFYYGIPIWITFIVGYLTLFDILVNNKKFNNKSILIYFSLIPLFASIGTNDFQYMAKNLFKNSEIPNQKQVSKMIEYSEVDNLKLDNKFYLYSPKVLGWGVGRKEFVGEIPKFSGCYIHLRNSTSFIELQSRYSYTDLVTQEYKIKPFFKTCKN